MSKLWLPLTKNILNYGTKPSNITVNNVTANTNGKLGGCYGFNGSSSHLLGTHDFMSNNTNEWTFACWMKLNATTAGQTLFSCRTSASQNGFTIFYYGSQWFIDDGARWQFTPTITIAKDTWYHVCVVRKKGVGKYLYINGVLDSSTTTTGTPTIVNTSLYAIGGSQNGATTVSGNWLNGYLNDWRVYDRALSIAEIKELAKGLIVHYKLDDVISSDNLITNGFGELGSENWTSATNRSTTEIPSGHSEIKASFYSGNMTKEYIPISTNHSYTISAYIKAMANQSGNKYPSIYPYDIDKKFIDYHKSQAGFNTATATTLREPLHKGDTVIYATDLSTWSTATNNHYFYAAIFGYKNSRGETYPDLFYTQDTPQFGTYSDKSHIDKTNNTITLNAAYTGEDRPAGTTICQSTQGATYFYPWNGIAVTSVTDWTFKTASFKPSSSPRLRAAAYFRWSTYGGLYIAGNKLVDNFFTDDKVADSSGYGYHGTKNGNITSTADTSRHSNAMVFDGTSAFIEGLALPTETKTISIWVKTAWTSSSGYQLAVHDRHTGLAIGWSSNQLITYIGTGNGGVGSRLDITTTNYTANKWNHIVVVKTGDKTRDIYVNGVKSAPTGSNYWAGDQDTLNIGNRHAGAYAGYFNGQISDFRAYSTELSADDILALYNVGARVANNGVMFGYEMKEG